MLIAPPARWQQIEALFADAIDRPAAGRAALLESACAGDPALRTSLERLLRAHDRAEGFLRELDSARAAALIEVSGIQDGEGQIIGRYRVVRQLGRGGMGVVYLAHDERLDRQVALKLLPPYLSADGEAARRLTEEARAASALDHPHIITIYEIGETADGRLFLATAYYEGETLRERITRGPLPITEARELATQIAEGLTAAHRKGIVHRDIKPENVLITTEGVAKVVDFGLAKVGAEALTRPGVAPGTVAYMSPEQTRGAPVDPRADLWSLGVVLYEMLAGVRPFHGEAEALVHGIRHDEPVALRELRPEVGARLARIVERCMLKDAAARYSNAADLLADLRNVAQVSDGEGTATGTHTGPPVLLRSRKRRSAAVVGTIAAIVLAVAGLWAWYGANGGEIAASADSRIAVVPFTPVVAADTALERLGRELVVTLSASLNGTAEIRTIEPITILAQHDGLNSGTALADAAARVRSLGAGRLVHGTLVRSGSDVRVDAGIFDSRTLESLGRAAASAAAGDIAALSDRTALALLRVLAAGADVQAPSLAVLTTSSVEALRAYLEGERAIALGQFNLAPAHFGRAIAADSTFRFAYWRYYYARSHGGQAVDSAVWASVLEHRYEFPEPDRLLIEVRLAEGQREGIARLQNLTERFPNYWPAWFELGRLLTVQGPYLGVPPSVTRNALERAAALNPHFVPTWERLLWMEEADRDTAAAARMLERLEAVRLDTLRQREINLDALGYYRCLHSLARSEGEFTPECATGVSELTSYRGPWVPERIALNAPEAGFARAAIELAERIQASGQASPEVFAAHSWAMALSWAARGDWEAAMSAAERYVRAGTHPRAALWVYGLAATGVWLGTVPAPRAAALRQLALRSPAAGTVNGAAEMAWLDGLVARADGDTTGLRDAVAELRRNSARSAPVLAESLEGLAAELAGDREGAARRLAALEWDNADRGWHLGFGQAHPYVNSVNRLAAGRWLLEAGDTAEAARVLLWHRAVLPGALHPLPAVNTALGNLALFELAQIEEPRGRRELARLYNMLFLERYDRPPPQHWEMVERARASRARLAARE